MEFMASLVRSLAWPTAVAVVVVVLRRSIGDALRRGVRRLKAGPVEVEFDEELAEVRDDLARSPELATVDTRPAPAGLGDELGRLVDLSPRTAVMEAFARIEASLRDRLAEAGVATPDRGGPALARLACQHRLISEESVRAVEGMAVLRNLAAHGRADEIDTARAEDYIALADAVLFALGDKPRS